MFIAIYCFSFNTLFNRNDISDGDLKSLETAFLDGMQKECVKKIKKLNEAEMLDYRVVFRGFDPSYHTSNFVESINFLKAFPSNAICLISTKLLGSEKCRNSLIHLPKSNVFYSLSSVKYIVSKIKDDSSDIKRNQHNNIIYQDDEVIIEENQEVLERIRFINDYTVRNSLEDSIDFIANKTVKWFKNHFIVNEPVKLLHYPNKTISPEYKIIEYQPSYMKLHLNSTHETMMILSNAFDNGWKLRVDGKTTPIYRVNAYYQGIKIRPDSNLYELYYRPPHMILFSFISLTTILIICSIGLGIKYRYSNR